MIPSFILSLIGTRRSSTLISTSMTECMWFYPVVKIAMVWRISKEGCGVCI